MSTVAERIGIDILSLRKRIGFKVRAKSCKSCCSDDAVTQRYWIVVNKV